MTFLSPTRLFNLLLGIALIPGWETVEGSSPPEDLVTVIIDSGIFSEHEIFRGKLLKTETVKGLLPEPLSAGTATDWAGWDFVESDAIPQDRTGHGTHTAGLVARASGAVTESGPKIVMFRTGDRRQQLIPVAQALETVVSLHDAGWHIPVVLCAFDYRQTEEEPAANERFSKAMTKLLEAGILCVCAAGNGSLDLDFPANAKTQYQVALRHENMITVAACTNDGHLLATSNYSPKSVLVAAPGLAAESAALDGGVSALSGSSQAAARVAGRLAKQASLPGFTEKGRLREWLLKEVRQDPSLVGRVATGGYLPWVP